VAGVKRFGHWIPGTINPSRIKGSQAEKNVLWQMYSDLGLDVELSLDGGRKVILAHPEL
jgi:hypothetical protein